MGFPIQFFFILVIFFKLGISKRMLFTLISLQRYTKKKTIRINGLNWYDRIYHFLSS